MIYLSDHLIELEHLGLGKYEGEIFRTLIVPERIQTIRVQGPNVYLNGPFKGKKTFQVIYSYKGYTESFVIDENEYVALIFFLALGKDGYNYWKDHCAYFSFMPYAEDFDDELKKAVDTARIELNVQKKGD